MTVLPSVSLGPVSLCFLCLWPFPSVWFLDPVSIYLPVAIGHLGAQRPWTPLCSGDLQL